MPLTMHALSVGVFTPMLENLSRILDKAVEHANAKGIDPTTLVQAKLAPDMFDLTRQVQIACDHAKNGTARLAGQEPPVFDDTETTFDELKARIARTLDFLSGFDVATLEGAEERQIVVPTPREFYFEMSGLEFLRDWSLPHFFFHVTTAYDILRAQGVELSKQDFVAQAARFIRMKPAS